MTAAEALAVRVTLLRTGYEPLPLHGKKPPLREWQKLENISHEQLQMWSRSWPDADNTGILCRRTPTFDADILNEDAARAIEDMVRDRYEEAGYLLIRIGRPPKRAFLFRTDEPFSKIVINLVPPNGGEPEKLEFLGDGQQVVAFGIHPDTHKPYMWHGGEPGAIKREDLPYIREAEARELIERAAELLVAEHGYVRAGERPRQKKTTGEKTAYDYAGTSHDGAADWQYLVDRIRAGESLHDSLRDLAAKLIAAGMAAGAAVNFLRALMESSSAARDTRWQDRFNEIPGLVDSGAEKFQAKPDKPPAVLAMLDVAAWEGRDVPPRQWAAYNRIARRSVTLLSGEGGVGKSILILQLLAAHVLASDWFGVMPEPGPVIYLNAEDDERELHFRLDAVRAHLGTSFAALKDLHLVPLAGEDALLGVPDRAGIIRATPLLDQLKQTAADMRPVLIALDTAADMFGGNENDRGQVRQFIGLLRGLAITANAGVLLASHPSLTGITTDSGLSGSTGWHNSVRSRLFFKAAKAEGDKANPDLRELEVRKNNYGPSGEIIRMRWQNGVFVPVSLPSSIEKAATEREAEHLFLDLLARYEKQGRPISPHPNSPKNYAPTVFAKRRDVNGTGRAAFEDAMQRLLDAGIIRIETLGPPSKQRSTLVRT